MLKILVTPAEESDLCNETVYQVRRLGISPYQLSALIQTRYNAQFLCQLNVEQLIDLRNHLISL